MADVNLTITVPDAYITKTINAFTHIANKQLRLEAHSRNYDSAWSFKILPQQSGESLIEFGERVLRELGKAVIRLDNIKEDYNRYNTEIAAINPPTPNVPDDVLQ